MVEKYENLSFVLKTRSLKHLKRYFIITFLKQNEKLKNRFMVTAATQLTRCALFIY